MDNFLNKLDYAFYDYKCSSPSNIALMTNEKELQEIRCEVDNNSYIVIKNNITHFRTNYNFDYDNKDNNFSSIKYLFANNYFGDGTYNSKCGLTKFINLETLVLSIHNIDNKIMLNLPNIKILIFVTTVVSLALQLQSELEFTNLPITLKKIIFKISEGKKENIEYLNLIKNKICTYKFPFGCKIFLIGNDDEIFTIL